MSVALVVASLIFIHRGTYPRTKGTDWSFVYFDSNAGKDLEDFKERFRTCSPEDHLDDVLGQVHRNSEILDRKFAELQRAYRCLLVAVIPLAVTLSLFGAVPPPT